MNRYRSFRDGESETGPVGIACRDAAEGLEDFGEHAFGDAGAMIRDAEDCAGSVRFERDFDCRAVDGVADRVAHNVFNCTAEEIFEAGDCAGVDASDRYRAVAGACFEIGIACDFLNKLSEIEWLGRAAVHAAIDASERE